MGCGNKSPMGCEEDTKQVKADENCNEEEDFCTMFEVTTKKCKEVDLSVIKEIIDQKK